MVTEIINRKEEKFLLTEDKYQKLLNKIKTYIQPDIYYQEKICSVYFDNENNDLITHSIDKPLYKEKIRLRSYNVPKEDDTVFLEMKKKYNGLSNKRRVVLTLKEANDYIYHGIMPKTNPQIMNEIDYVFRYYQLKPKISITYDREAFVSKEDETFRITFDSQIKSSITNVTLNELKDEESVLKNQYIMEIKTLKGLPIWLNQALNELKVYPISYSKYGEIYKKLKESDIHV